MLPLPAVVFLCLCTGVGAEWVPLPCNQTKLQAELQLCLSRFISSMETSGYREGCVWPDVRGAYGYKQTEQYMHTEEADKLFKENYIILKNCVDDWVKATGCLGVGSQVDDLFLKVHQTYFSECGRIQDPPLVILVLMVAPLIITTMLLPLLCSHLAPDMKS